MSLSRRAVRHLAGIFLFPAALLVVTLPSMAQDRREPAEPAEPGSEVEQALVPEAVEFDAQAATESARDAERELAREERVRASLERKERKRARREILQTEREEEKLARGEAREQKALEMAALDGEADPESPERTRTRGSGLPRDVARVQELVRANRLGQDPSVVRYLDLIDAQAASPSQIAALGNFLGEGGMHQAALVYYDLALRLERRNTVLWMNYGTLLRQLGDPGAAASAYSKALSIDPNNAFAHYNLGAALDQMGEYEGSIREYKIALTLDPTLGEAEHNPQAANNEKLLAVKLMLYQEQAGSLGLPLMAVPGGELPGAVDPAPEGGP